MEQWKIVKSVSWLPQNIVNTDSQPKVIELLSLPQEIQACVRSMKTYCKHILVDADRMHRVLERYGQNYGILWDVTINDEIMNEIQSMDFNNDREIEGNFDNNDVNIKDWEELRLSKIINNYGEGRKDTIGNSNALVMKLPDNLASGNDEYSKTATESSSDPNVYLEEKYYGNLFTLTMPLAYFVKSSLSRTKNLCKSVCIGNDYQNHYKTLIKNNILPIKIFDDRHDRSKLLETDFNVPYISEYQKKCVSQFSYKKLDSTFQNEISDFTNSGNTNDLLISILKLRELKLQIILLLETLYLEKLDERFKDFEAHYKKKLVQRSRNVSKGIFRTRRLKQKKQNGKKGIIINTETNQDELNVKKNSSESTTNEITDYCELLDLYLDKLTILDILITSGISTDNLEENRADSGWELLKEYQSRLMDKNNEASLVGFANYILIPYFNKKTPQAIKFVIKKLKGPSLRKRPGLDRSKTNIDNTKSELYDLSETKTISEVPTRKNSFSSAQLSSDDKSDLGGASKYKHSIPSIQEDIGVSRTASNLSEFFESVGPPLKKFGPVSRTKSDLSFLQRRQFAMDLPKPVEEEKIIPDNISSNPISNGNNSLKWSMSQTSTTIGRNSITRTKQQSFRRVGRQNSSKAVKKLSELSTGSTQRNLVQVTATPMAKGNNRELKKTIISPGIIESPAPGAAISTPSQESRIVGSNTNAGQGIVSPKQKKVKRRLFAP